MCAAGCGGGGGGSGGCGGAEPASAPPAGAAQPALGGNAAAAGLVRQQRQPARPDCLDVTVGSIPGVSLWRPSNAQMRLSITAPFGRENAPGFIAAVAQS